MGKLYHIGVDLHKKNLQVAVLDNAGEILDMRRLGKMINRILFRVSP